MADLEQEITNAASAPKSAASDGQSATAHSLGDLVKADRHLAAKTGAAANAATCGIRIAKIVNTGAQ